MMHRAWFSQRPTGAPLYVILLLTLNYSFLEGFGPGVEQAREKIWQAFIILDIFFGTVQAMYGSLPNLTRFYFALR
jgi:hypothetical protein